LGAPLLSQRSGTDLPGPGVANAVSLRSLWRDGQRELHADDSVSERLELAANAPISGLEPLRARHEAEWVDARSQCGGDGAGTGSDAESEQRLTAPVRSIEDAVPAPRAFDRELVGALYRLSADGNAARGLGRRPDDCLPTGLATQRHPARSEATWLGGGEVSVAIADCLLAVTPVLRGGQHEE
jgi:hypothetical protein